MRYPAKLASVRKLHLTFKNSGFAASAMHSLTQLSCGVLILFPALHDILINVYEATQKVDHFTDSYGLM